MIRGRRGRGECFVMREALLLGDGERQPAAVVMMTMFGSSFDGMTRHGRKHLTNSLHFP